MSHRTGIVAILLAAALSLVGCAGTSMDESTTAPKGEVAAGETVTGGGYSFVAPEGWGVPKDMPELGADTLVVDSNDTDGFADNLNVVVTPGGEVTPEQVESDGISELEGAGATEVAVGVRLTVAGSESANLSALFSSGGTEYRIRQYYLTNNGQTYVVTFSFSPAVSEADRDDLAQSVLATWEWA